MSWRRLWEGWKRVGRRIGDAQARALLIFFYFVILAPFALALRGVGDPLGGKGGGAPRWRPRRAADGEPVESARRQS